MTEAEWLVSCNAAELFHHCRTWPTGQSHCGRGVHPHLPSDRKLRLFSCACCRLAWNGPTDPVRRDTGLGLIAMLEQSADSEAPSKVRWLITHEGSAARSPCNYVWNATAPVALSGASNAIANAADIGTDTAVHAIQAAFLHDIIGNPFAAKPGVKAWLNWTSSTVVALACAIYAERAFDRMPILGDALEEAGCTSTDILEHCRQGGLHVLGCWVVDLILGKE